MPLGIIIEAVKYIFAHRMTTRGTRGIYSMYERGQGTFNETIELDLIGKEGEKRGTLVQLR